MTVPKTLKYLMEIKFAPDQSGDDRQSVERRGNTIKFPSKIDKKKDAHIHGKDRIDEQRKKNIILDYYRSGS